MAVAGKHGGGLVRFSTPELEPAGSLATQLRQVLRRLRRAPLFTAATLLTLAVGIALQGTAKLSGYFTTESRQWIFRAGKIHAKCFS
jgi:hypothetical protein